MEGHRVYLSASLFTRQPEERQQLTARIVQDAAMQRAMTSGGCGMDAWPYLPCSPHAADLEPRRAGISLFRQHSQGHSSVQWQPALVCVSFRSRCICVALCRF